MAHLYVTDFYPDNQGTIVMLKITFHMLSIRTRICLIENISKIFSLDDIPKYNNPLSFLAGHDYKV